MKTLITSLTAVLTGCLVAFTALAARAAPTVYIPLGVANQVIAVDAATDKITASYPGVENAHGLVATPDGEYLVAGSLKQMPAGGKDAGMSHLFLVHPEHGHVMATIAVRAGAITRPLPTTGAMSSRPIRCRAPSAWSTCATIRSRT
ncbi:MAG TPA: hypothetical protein VKA50_14480 [Gammaproteobacteria bacterium]|nr:hypothetical protein [Gammaproteobacteria bacterium]